MQFHLHKKVCVCMCHCVHVHPYAIATKCMSKSNFITVTEDGQLHALCKDGRYNQIEEFLQTYKGDLPAKLVYRQGVFGYTPIHEAVSSGHSKVLKLLLDHGGNPNCHCNGGYTPLHLAASSGNIDCIRVLLVNNADTTKTDEYGKTPIQTAELSSKHAVIKVLKSAGELNVHEYCVCDFCSVNKYVKSGGNG